MLIAKLVHNSFYSFGNTNQITEILKSDGLPHPKPQMCNPTRF